MIVFTNKYIFDVTITLLGKHVKRIINKGAQFQIIAEFQIGYSKYKFFLKHLPCTTMDSMIAQPSPEVFFRSHFYCKIS